MRPVRILQPARPGPLQECRVAASHGQKGPGHGVAGGPILAPARPPRRVPGHARPKPRGEIAPPLFSRLFFWVHA
jgi:hypothetical protein